MINKQNYEINMPEIGRRIKETRTRLHITHKDIYDNCGISSGALSMIENGKRVPTITVMFKIACILNCSIDWLITGISPDREISDIDQKKLLELYQSMSAKDKKELLELARIKVELT